MDDHGSRLVIALLARLALAGVVTPPELVTAVVPPFPDAARELRLRGDVVLRVAIDETGRVTDVALITGVHPLLDDVALDAARALRFAPARDEAGAPVASEVEYRFHFDYALVDQREGAAFGAVYGRVEDVAGAPVPGARIALVPEDPASGAPRSFQAGDDGRFSTGFLPAGRWIVEVQVGDQPATPFPLEIAAGEVVQSAFPISADPNEIVVYGQRATWREVERGPLVADEGTVTGAYTLTRRDIEATPGSLEDVARAVQALPGVVGDPDLLAGFNVRGGETSDVVFLLDRVPLDDPFHLGGFNSLFNPDMIREVKFYAGAPPADVPAGTSGVLAVESWDGAPRAEGQGFDGALDLSAQSARALVMGPLDDDERFTVALAARRTYLEGYFQIMKWANLIDTAFAAPEYSELSARAAWRVPRHRLMFTALRSGDSLALVDSDDASSVTFEGSFVLQNSLQLYALDHTFEPSPHVTWRSTVAATLDRSFLERDLGGVTSRTFRTNRGYARTDLAVATPAGHRFDVGGDVGYSALSAEGEIEDPRAVPSWANTGIVDLGADLVALGDIPPWSDVSVYAQATADLPVKVRTGMRGRLAGATDELLWSPSAGLSLPLPTGTIPKVAGGLYHRTPRDPVALDPVLGNPDLASERAAQVVVGVDQGFPLAGEEAGGLVRVEGYWTRRTLLVVHPDDPAAPGLSYDNVGAGRDRGLDVLLALRTGRVSGTITYAFLRAERYNPLNTLFPSVVAPTQDQRHTFGASSEVQLSGRWRATARYSFHTGRPVSAVEAASEDTARLVCLNCDRLGPTHDLAIRAEWRRVYERHLLSFYAEVLNAANFRSDFTPIATVEDGLLEPSMLSHLPIRPFLGIRSDF